MKAIITTVAALLLLTAGSVRAWDGERKGFLLGLGLGIGYDSYSGVQYDEIGPEEEDNSSVAFAASPRIGYAWNNRIGLFYSRHPFMFSVKNESNDDVTITTCIESIEMLYYLQETAPSLYLGLGAGIGSWVSGLLYTATGSYIASFVLAIAASGVGMATFWVVRALREERVV